MVAPWLTFGSLLAPVGSLLAPLGSLLAPFGSLLVPVGSLLAPAGSLLAPFGSPLAHFWCPRAQFWCSVLHFGSPRDQFSHFCCILSSFFVSLGKSDSYIISFAFFKRLWLLGWSV